MEKVTKPNVSNIAIGKNLVAKQMKAEAGALLPKHLVFQCKKCFNFNAGSSLLFLIENNHKVN